MAGVFVALLALAYLAFLIDWKELREVLAQGGWASIVVYGIVGVLVVAALTGPSAVPAPGMH